VKRSCWIGCNALAKFLGLRIAIRTPLRDSDGVPVLAQFRLSDMHPAVAREIEQMGKGASGEKDPLI